MFGLILKFHLHGTFHDPVQVCVVGSRGELDDIISIDPTNSADAWPRHDIDPIAQRDVQSEFGGGLLEAYICVRKTSNFKAELRNGDRS